MRCTGRWARWAGACALSALALLSWFGNVALLSWYDTEPALTPARPSREARGADLPRLDQATRERLAALVDTYLQPWRACSAAQPAAEALFNRTVSHLHAIALHAGRDENFRGNFLGVLHLVHEGDSVLRYERFGKGWYFRAHSVAYLFARLLEAHPDTPPFSLLINLSDNPMVDAEAERGPRGGDACEASPPLLLSFGTARAHADVPIPDFSFHHYLDANVGGFWRFPPLRALQQPGALEHVGRAWARKARSLHWRGAEHNLKADPARRTLVEAVRTLREEDERAAGAGAAEAGPIAATLSVGVPSASARDASGRAAAARAAPLRWDVHFSGADAPPASPPGAAAPFATLESACAHQYLLTMVGIGFSARDKYLLACGSVLVQQQPAVSEYYAPLLLADGALLRVQRAGEDLRAKLGGASGEVGAELARRAAAFAVGTLSEGAVLGYLRELVGALHARGLSAPPSAWTHAPPWRTFPLPRPAAALSRMCVELANYGPKLDKLEICRCAFLADQGLSALGGRPAGGAKGSAILRESAPNAVECCARCRALPKRSCRCFEFDRATRTCVLARGTACDGTQPREGSVAGMPCKQGTPDVTFASSGKGGWDDRVRPEHVRAYESA